MLPRISVDTFRGIQRYSGASNSKLSVAYWYRVLGSRRKINREHCFNIIIRLSRTCT